MVETVVELVVAPALVAASTLAAGRWGSRAGGVVSAFPAIVGPVLLILALEHGHAFAARAANGTLLGLVALGAFAVAYARAAVRRSWRASLLAGWACAGACALAVGWVARGAGSPAGLIVATLSLGVAFRALPPVPGAPAVEPAREPRSRAAIPARMALTAALVTLLAAAAGALGPLAGGMLAALPVLACVLAVSTHREAGAEAVVGLLRGMLAGMAGFVAFCELVALVIGPYGIAPAFAGATAFALIVQAGTAYAPSAIQPAVRSHSSRASAGVTAAPGCLREQSS
ncbi:MAG TPA: hypothetical protein VHX88_11095 [Solirubrobacteraceae bacterium]|nr:hypothetical protein [Solirubrobacteraceae bacterium]